MLALLSLTIGLRAVASPPIFTPPTYQLHSSLPFHEIRIPFVLENGAIVVKANLSGKFLTCIFDTGSAVINWDAALNLRGKKTGDYNLITDGGGHIRIVDEYCLDSIQLGGYTLFGVPGYSVRAATNKKAAAPTPTQQKLLLGNALFAQVILTIDYQKRQLILRDPHYDLTQLPKRAQDRTFDFSWADAGTNRSVGTPILQGKVGTNSARIGLDTGWGADEVGLVKKYYQEHISTPSPTAPPAEQTTATTNMAFGTFDTAVVPQIPLSLDEDPLYQFTPPALLVTNWLSSEVDAIIGTEILQKFRITLDYTRKKALFEPYDLTPVRMITVTVNGVSYLIPNGGSITVKPDETIIIKVHR